MLRYNRPSVKPVADPTPVNGSGGRLGFVEF